MFAIVSPEHDSYSYAGTGYAKLRAESQLANNQVIPNLTKSIRVSEGLVVH